MTVIFHRTTPQHNHRHHHNRHHHHHHRHQRLRRLTITTFEITGISSWISAIQPGCSIQYSCEKLEKHVSSIRARSSTTLLYIHGCVQLIVFNRCRYPWNSSTKKKSAHTVWHWWFFKRKIFRMHAKFSQRNERVKSMSLAFKTE